MAEIDDFLKGKAEAEPMAEAEAPPAPEPKDAAPPEAEAPPAPPEGEPEPQQQTRDGRTVPLSALEGERKARQDWKDKAARAETERDELRKQLEEIKRQPPAPPPQQYQPPAPINPAEDPQGFVSRIQEVMLNERLNQSELLARRDHGAEKIEAAIAEFKTAAQADPALFPKLYGQPDPYGWMLQQVDKMRAQREIGDDPSAYKSKLEAEIRERLMAEMGQQQPQQPRVSPAAGMAPSLANVRSAAPRSAPAFSGPPSLGDVLGR
jgi:hypothetical protein